MAWTTDDLVRAQLAADADAPDCAVWLRLAIQEMERIRNICLDAEAKTREAREQAAEYIWLSWEATEFVLPAAVDREGRSVQQVERATNWVKRFKNVTGSNMNDEQ